MPSGQFAATLSRRYDSEEMAKALAASLSPDNESYAESTVTGPLLTITVTGKSLGELRRSLDDTLACLGTAEKTWLRASRIPTGTHSARRPTP